MNEDLLELINRLLRQTNSSAVQWEDASTLSGGERFRINFGDAVIEVYDGEEQRAVEDGELYLPFYRLQVLNNRGFLVAEEEQTHEDPHYKPLRNLFQAARSSARNTRQVLGSLLQRLGPPSAR